MGGRGVNSGCSDELLVSFLVINCVWSTTPDSKVQGRYDCSYSRDKNG